VKKQQSTVDPVLSKLDVLVRLTAAGLIEGKTPTERIKLLGQTGFQAKDIADIVGRKPSYVRATLSRLRKASGRKRKQKKGTAGEALKP
jgi:DNA-binding CsgD family transcriptional regulator